LQTNELFNRVYFSVSVEIQSKYKVVHPLCAFPIKLAWEGRSCSRLPFIMVFPNKFLDNKPKGFLIDDIDDGLDIQRFVVK